MTDQDRPERGAEAAPTEVRVGDPITLTVRVAGPAYLDNVVEQALKDRIDERIRVVQV